MSRSDPLTWTATGDGDCMGDHDPDTFTTGCQLGDGYEHDLTTEGYSSIAWMLLGGRPPADDGDCDGDVGEFSGASRSDIDGRIVSTLPWLVVGTIPGAMSWELRANRGDDCDGGQP